MFPGLQDLMRQAQQMSQRMAQIKQELAQKTVEGSAGGGMVRAKMNGAMQLLEVRIDPEIVDGEELEMLQDLVVAAVNQAMAAAKQMAAEANRELTGGLPIPPGFENLLGGLGGPGQD